DRAEDVADASTASEEILHLLGRDGPVLGPRPGLLLPVRALPRARRRAACLGSHPVRAELVVELALLRVRKHVVRLRDLLEASFRPLVAGVEIGVVLA